MCIRDRKEECELIKIKKQKFEVGNDTSTRNHGESQYFVISVLLFVFNIVFVFMYYLLSVQEFDK